MLKLYEKYMLVVVALKHIRIATFFDFMFDRSTEMLMLKAYVLINDEELSSPSIPQKYINAMNALKHSCRIHLLDDTFVRSILPLFHVYRAQKYINAMNAVKHSC